MTSQTSEGTSPLTAETAPSVRSTDLPPVAGAAMAANRRKGKVIFGAYCAKCGKGATHADSDEHRQYFWCDKHSYANV